MAGLRVPVVSAPMFLISGPELVVAACQAGVVGAFPTPIPARWPTSTPGWGRSATSWPGQAAPRGRSTWSPTAPTRDWRRTCGGWRSTAADRHHRARLANPRDRDREGLRRHRHRRRGHDQAGAEGGGGRGGRARLHLGRRGRAGYAPFAFISAVRDFFGGLVTIGGGTSDGAGVAGAIRPGPLVYMGTRFIATKESMAPDAQADGGRARPGRPGDHRRDHRDPRLVAPPEPDRARSRPRQPDPAGRPRLRLDRRRGRRWKDLSAAGQGLQTIRAVEPTAVVVDRLAAEYHAAAARLAGRVSG